jgi:hypothetical protein
MSSIITAGAGFLIAVLWFDLMFDIQVRGVTDGADSLPETTLASIAAYYRRVTTTAAPMQWFVSGVMLGTLLAVLAQLIRSEIPRFAGGASLIALGLPVVLAGTRVVPAAARLGTRRDAVEVQSRMAREIFRWHLYFFVSIIVLLVLQLTYA